MFRENFIDWSHLISELRDHYAFKVFSINYACAHAQEKIFYAF